MVPTAFSKFHGGVRKAMETHGPNLFSAKPVITPVDVIATKTPGSLPLPPSAPNSRNYEIGARRGEPHFSLVTTRPRRITS